MSPPPQATPVHNAGPPAMTVLVAATAPAFGPTLAVERVHQLVKALTEAGHRAEAVVIPVSPGASHQAASRLMLRLLDVSWSPGRLVDRLIVTEPRAAFVYHPHRVAWLVSLDGLDPRDLDPPQRQALADCRAVWAADTAVDNRLRGLGVGTLQILPWPGVARGDQDHNWSATLSELLA